MEPTTVYIICIHVQVWDYGSGELIEEVPFPAKEHGQFLYVGRFCSSDIIAAGGSGTNDLKIINRRTKEVTVSHVFRSFY